MRSTLCAAVVLAASMLVSTASVTAADGPQIAPPPAPSIPMPTAEQDAPVKDPVESLNNAIKAYQGGKYFDSLAAIDDAKKAVGAKHLAVYRELLPQAPGPGWTTTDKPDTLLMSGVTREYNANGQTVSITYTIDPNMVKMLSSTNKMVNAMLGGSNDNDDKPIMIKGHKASYREMKLGDKIIMYKFDIPDDEALVSIQSATIGKDTLLKFAELVDYEKLKAAH